MLNDDEMKRIYFEERNHLGGGFYFSLFANHPINSTLTQLITTLLPLLFLQ